MSRFDFIAWYEVEKSRLDQSVRISLCCGFMTPLNECNKVPAAALFPLPSLLRYVLNVFNCACSDIFTWACQPVSLAPLLQSEEARSRCYSHACIITQSIEKGWLEKIVIRGRNKRGSWGISSPHEMRERSLVLSSTYATHIHCGVFWLTRWRNGGEPLIDTKGQEEIERPSRLPRKWKQGKGCVRVGK